jgi:hypothetical protein
VLTNLRSAHNGICNYSAVWIPRSGGSTVDHYEPLARRHDLAYEWSNYRFASQYVNGRKGQSTHLLDPFDIQAEWFALEFPSLLVIQGSQLPLEIADRFRRTVERLGLNDEKLIQDRLHWLRQYCEGSAPFQFLVRHAPFVAAELQRQNLVQSIAALMSF